MVTCLERNEARLALGGAAQRLFCDRIPFALSSISQIGERGSVSGKAELYYAPMGMFVRVWARGLEDGVYSLVLRAGEIRLYLPPLYARDGYAWTEALTGKISPSEMLHGSVDIMAYDSKQYTLVASGKVHSPLGADIELPCAL